jgi:hypothetical protein
MGRTTRAAAAIAAATLLLGSAACGSDNGDGGGDGGADGDDDAQTEPTSEPATSAAAADETDACGVADVAAVEAALGSSIGTGDAGTVSVDDNGQKWQADGCEWEADDVELELRIVASAALPGDCPELSSPVYEVTPVADLGDAAWFEWDDLQGEGAVRVCSASGMAESRVESGDAPLDQAVVRATALALVAPAVPAG